MVHPPPPVVITSMGHTGAASAGPSRLLDTRLQDRCLARLGPGVRREALLAAAHQVMVWLSSGLQSVGHRDEAWLQRGLPSS